MANWKAFERELRKYIADKTEEGLRRKTLMEYERVNLLLFKMLEAAGMETHPLRINRPEINYIRSQIPVRRDGNHRNQEYHIKTLMQFLRWAGNPDTKKLTPRYPSGVRTNADWMDEERMEFIRISVEHNPELSMLFHLEGDLALRRIEVLRLCLQDFDGEVVHICGKGPGGGKPRDIRKHPETDSYLADFLVFREDLVRRALRYDPTVQIPDGMFLYYPRNRRLGACQKTALDERLYHMRELSGLYFGHHTLRRTCAREMWKAGAELVTISEILGHKSIKTTREYLGLTIEDQAEAHNLRHNRQRRYREEVRQRLFKGRQVRLEMEYTGQ